MPVGNMVIRRSAVISQAGGALVIVVGRINQAIVKLSGSEKYDVFPKYVNTKQLTIARLIS
jgi:hypothetical protein